MAQPWVTSRNYTINVQPAFMWKQPGVQVSPLVTMTQWTMTVLTGGAATSEYIYRAVWRTTFLDDAGALQVQHALGAGQLQPEP